MHRATSGLTLLALGAWACGDDNERSAAERPWTLEAQCTARVNGVGDVTSSPTTCRTSCSARFGNASFAALEAQAVAARSYLYFTRLETAGEIEDGPRIGVLVRARPDRGPRSGGRGVVGPLPLVRGRHRRGLLRGGRAGRASRLRRGKGPIGRGPSAGRTGQRGRSGDEVCRRRNWPRGGLPARHRQPWMPVQNARPACPCRPPSRGTSCASTTAPTSSSSRPTATACPNHPTPLRTLASRRHGRRADRCSTPTRARRRRAGGGRRRERRRGRSRCDPETSAKAVRRRRRRAGPARDLPGNPLTNLPPAPLLALSLAAAALFHHGVTILGRNYWK